MSGTSSSGAAAGAEQPRPDDAADPGLTERERDILAFEHRWWAHAGAMDEAIRAELGLTPARYYQLLNAVIDSPAAVRHDPMLVHRLQRVREARMSRRTMRRLGDGWQHR